MHLWGNWGSCSPSWVSPLIFHPRDNQPHCLRTLRVFTSGLSHSEYPLGTPQVTRGKGGSITPSYCRLVILTHWCLMGVWFRSDLFIGGSLYRPSVFFVEHWRGPRTVQLRVSSPLLTLTLTIVPQRDHNVKSFFRRPLMGRPFWGGFSSNRVQTLTDAPTLTQCPLSSYINIISYSCLIVKSFFQIFSEVLREP